MGTKPDENVKFDGLAHMTECDLNGLLNVVIENHVDGMIFKDMFDVAVRNWPGNPPKDRDQFTKFLSTVFYSPRCPEYYKSWYLKVRTKNKINHIKTYDKSHTRDDAELARLFATENESLKKRITQLEAEIRTKKEPCNDKDFTKSRLKEVIALCKKLIDVNAIDPSQAFMIVMGYLEKL